MKRVVVWSMLGLLIFFGGAIARSPRDLSRYLPGQRRESTQDTIQPRAPSRVGAIGRIEPSSKIIDIGTPLDDRVLRLLVKEGQQVAAGEELAYLDSYGVTLAQKQEFAALLEEAKSRVATLRADGQAKIHAAQLGLKSIEQIDPLEIDLQKSRLRVSEILFKESESKFLRAKRMREDNAVSVEDYDRRQVELQSQQELLESDRLTLSVLQAKFQLGLELAAAAVEEARTTMEQSLAAIPIQSLERNLELGDARLKQTIILAPISGQVLKIHTRPGERIASKPILQLGNTDEMHAVAEIYETDISRVRVGQSATVTCPALGQPIHGNVVEVGVMIYKNDVLNVDPAADADARVVEVRIRLDEPQRVAALTNLQVDVLIDVGVLAE